VVRLSKLITTAACERKLANERPLCGEQSAAIDRNQRLRRRFPSGRPPLPRFVSASRPQKKRPACVTGRFDAAPTRFLKKVRVANRAQLQCEPLERRFRGSRHERVAWRCRCRYKCRDWCCLICRGKAFFLPRRLSQRPGARKMIEVYKIPVPKEKLCAMPESERALLILLGYAANQINCFSKMVRKRTRTAPLGRANTNDSTRRYRRAE
jgi:hypothetical protein